MTDEQMPRTVDDLLSRIDSQTAYKIGSQMAALYSGFAAGLNRPSITKDFADEAKMFMMMSFMMVYQIGTKND